MLIKSAVMSESVFRATAGDLPFKQILTPLRSTRFTDYLMNLVRKALITALTWRSAWSEDVQCQRSRGLWSDVYFRFWEQR